MKPTDCVWCKTERYYGCNSTYLRYDNMMYSGMHTTCLPNLRSARQPPPPLVLCSSKKNFFEDDRFTMAATNPSSSLSFPTSALRPTKLNGKEASITGFVMKLNNMVNGAPDDIVSVSSWFVIWECVVYPCRTYYHVAVDLELSLRILAVSSGLSLVIFFLRCCSHHVPLTGGG